jgi:predicted lipoprotein with Yx(FWY)xxD motif
MFTTRRFAGLLIASLALVAACSSGATTAPPTQAPTVAPSAPAATTAGSAGSSTVTIGMATTSLGPVLVGPNGLTLYIHAGDSATSSTCTGTCATAWPPLVVASGQTASLASGVTGTLGTLTRADGTAQVTFNGMPLYGWKGDKAPGDTTGQNVAGFTVAMPGGSAPAASPTSSGYKGGY